MHVLVVSIGPVQEFIESARKCRDLWFGSWLLSELARAAAQGIVACEGRPEAEVLVFPGAKTTDRDCSVANKVVARIAGDPEACARAGEEAMRERLRQVRDAAFGRVAPTHPRRLELFRQPTAEQQVDAMMEYLWASAPEGGGYADAWREAERLLAAVKNSKAWEQPGWALDGVPKSSLDGARESVLDEALFDRPVGRRPGGAPSRDRRRREFGVHGAERLCGVGLLKRFGNRETDQGKGDVPHRIFSTSHVASAPFRAGLAKLDAHGPWTELCNALDRISPDITADLDVAPGDAHAVTGHVDGSIFYEGRLVETLEELEIDPSEQAKARAALRAFLRKVRDLGEPDPYYALVLADGDRMGAVIGSMGRFEQHRELSEALEKYASSTRDVVRRHEGKIVYAGGDDILGLVPTHTVLACASKLADAFARAMKKWQVDDGGVRRSPTLSMGIVIAHHLLPLDEALAMVRVAEKRAKAVPGKNALAITVKRRGGEAVEVEGPWGGLDERLRKLIALYENDAISTKAQYELMDLADRLRGAAPDKRDALRAVRAAEAVRILRRKQPKKGAEEMRKETLDELEGLGAYVDPARLGRELYVAHVLAHAQAQANPEVAAVAHPSQEAHA